MRNFIKVAALAAVTLSGISVFAQSSTLHILDKLEVYNNAGSQYMGDYVRLTENEIRVGSSVPTTTPYTIIKDDAITVSTGYTHTYLKPTSLTLGNTGTSCSIVFNRPLNFKYGTKTVAKLSSSTLQLDGKIYCEALEVKQINLADYVFSENYQLKSLKEVESFIVENKHLPNVPSAKTVAEEGMNVGEFQNILLEKVEELTLYIIEQQKKIEALEAKIQ